MPNHIVYKISDSDGNTYIGSTSIKLSYRVNGHLRDYNNFPDRKLYRHWRFVGIDAMKAEILADNIQDKQSRKALEQKYITEVPRDKLLNTIKADCPNYEASRSINSGIGEPEKTEAKRRTRRALYWRHKKDPEWLQRERERNKLKMRELRADPNYKQKYAVRRRELYQIEKQDHPELLKEKQRIKNKKYYKPKTTHKLPQETTSTTERVCAGEDISNPL